MNASDVITQGAAAAGFAKVLVEIVKMSLPNVSRNMIPLFALLLSEASAFLLVTASGTMSFDKQTIAVVILMGIGATAGAIGVSAVQTKADKVDERIDTALTLEPGSNKADVDAAIAAKETTTK
jgi:hypothetical protein